MVAGAATNVRRCASPIVALLAAALATAPAQAASRLVVGIADQKPATFGDARLLELPVRHARLSVAWDAMRYRWQRAEIDAWMRAAEAAGMVPQVTFARSRTRRFSLPPTAEYARQVRTFRRRYREVREYSPWNEPNIAVRAVNSDPRRIASYYNTLRSQCPRCTVLGADLVDSSSLERWLRAYLRVFPPGRRPRHWGLHNYVDANSRSSWGTRTMLRLAPGEIWFNEVGALVRRPTPSSSVRPDRRTLMRVGKRHAAASMRRVFALAARSRRITRVYVYHWKSSRKAVWDSALVSSRGTPRPSFDVFAAQARMSSGEP
ncbi:MAG TPA: hypothetical protein VNT54_01450 [Solirubrobacteraceae bacterium]|nr:hypothetical protein [Solirubrobacteraceae bacterium]